MATLGLLQKSSNHWSCLKVEWAASKSDGFPLLGVFNSLWEAGWLLISMLWMSWTRWWLRSLPAFKFCYCLTLEWDKVTTTKRTPAWDTEQWQQSRQEWNCINEKHERVTLDLPCYWLEPKEVFWVMETIRVSWREDGSIERGEHKSLGLWIWILFVFIAF